MKCRIMGHFIWFFTFYQSRHLIVTSLKGFNHESIKNNIVMTVLSPLHHWIKKWSHLKRNGMQCSCSVGRVLDRGSRQGITGLLVWDFASRITVEDRKLSWHDWKIVDLDIKHQNKHSVARRIAKPVQFCPLRVQMTQEKNVIVWESLYPCTRDDQKVLGALVL